MIVDAQVHLWEAHRPDRPWPSEQVGKPSFIAVPGARPHRPEPLGADELLGMMDQTGIDRAIIVPPSPVGDSNDTALEAAARFPARFAVMGRFNPEAPNARSALETWLDQPGMLGIRMTFFKPHWARWLKPGAVDWFWAGCERLNIPVMALAPGLLADIAVLAKRHPGLTIILDHMARQSALRDDACFADLDAMLALVAERSIVSSSRYAATAPCACCARRPVSKRIVRVPKRPLSRTASAAVISGPSKRSLLLSRPLGGSAKEQAQADMGVHTPDRAEHRSRSPALATRRNPPDANRSRLGDHFRGPASCQPAPTYMYGLFPPTLPAGSGSGQGLSPRHSACDRGVMSDFAYQPPEVVRPVLHDEDVPDEDREVDLDDDAELKLPPPTIDPDEAVEHPADPAVEDLRDEVKGTGALDE